jgi:hypothetical protein
MLRFGDICRLLERGLWVNTIGLLVNTWRDLKLLGIPLGCHQFGCHEDSITYVRSVMALTLTLWVSVEERDAAGATREVAI